MEQTTIALIIVAIVIVLFATEILPAATTAMLSSMAMAVVGVISYKEAFAGFSNPVVIFVIGFAAIGNAMAETGAAQFIGKAVMKKYKGGEKGFLILILACTGIFSMFMSNTATIVLFMSIATAMELGSNGKVTRKNTFMGMGIATVAGGACTLIGSTTQLAVQSLLVEAHLPAMKMFSLMFPGIFVFAALLLYYYFIGYNLQKKVFEKGVADESTIQCRSKIASAEIDTDVVPNPKNIKMWIPLIVMVVCIILTIVGVNMAMVAMVGAFACVITGCITQKKMLQSTDWNTIFIIVGSIGFAAGVEKSGAGELIAKTVINMVGTDVNPFFIFAAIVLVGTIMTNFMANISTAMILLPISIRIAEQLGMNAFPLVIGIIWAADLPFSTPIGASPITMTMTAGYRFTDYTKVGGPFNVIAYILVVILTPIFYPLIGK